MTVENKTSGVSVNDKNDDEILKQQEDESVLTTKVTTTKFICNII